MVGRKGGRKRYRLGELMVQREALVREADPGRGHWGNREVPRLRKARVREAALSCGSRS